MNVSVKPAAFCLYFTSQLNKEAHLKPVEIQSYCMFTHLLCVSLRGAAGRPGGNIHNMMSQVLPAVDNL